MRISEEHDPGNHKMAGSEPPLNQRPQSESQVCKIPLSESAIWGELLRKKSLYHEMEPKDKVA